MKVKFDIECTPEEARKFMGLPDVVPMQEALMAQMQDQLADNIRQLDAETLMKNWIPMSLENWGEMQKTFWSQMGMGGTGFAMNPAPEPEEEESPRRRRK